MPPAPLLPREGGSLHGAGEPSVQGTAAASPPAALGWLCLPPGHPPAAPREGSGRPEPQDPAALSPLAKPPPPAGRSGDSTHGLAVPSGGAILPWGPRGSLRPGNGLCIGALHGRACGTLGTDGAGGALSAWFSFLALQASLGTKRRGYRLGRGHTRSPASWAGPGITQRGGADKTGAGDRQGDVPVDAHGAGVVVPATGGGLPGVPCTRPVLWLGSGPSRGHPVPLAPTGTGGTEDGREPQSSVRVPSEQSRGSDCSGVPVVTSPLSGRAQGSTRSRPTW